MVQSSSSSGIFFQEDGQTNFGSSSNSLPPANVGPFSGDVSNTVLNSVASSGPSIGASSLVTDANSGLSGGPHLQRSASINTESYTRLPASPISFSSNNISISGASVMDGSSVLQQSPNQGASSATSLPRLQKRPRLDIKQEDIIQQQVMQQLLQRRDQMHLHNSSPQLQALIQQQRLRQQEQQVLQSMTPVQRVQFLQQQQQQMQLRQQLQVQGMPSASAVKRPYDGGVCSRRLMQYLYHQRQWPADNSIAYWRKFVAEYYSPRAKKRWCLSQYNNVGHHALGVFPQAAKDAWQCDICGSKSGRGFEATFEVLPRLNEIKFSSGVVDELLFLDLPRECRFPSGIMMLEYAKAVQESVYEQLRVVREGQLRILFAPDLKILSWEFCARRHEELLPRKLVAPQVNQLLEVAQKCQSTIAKSGPDGVSQPDLQANSVLVVTAGHQLARSLELQSLNDLGFSKRYVRCLQIADVVNSMKDLMDFCRQHKKGPIEGLKNFPQRQSKFQMDPTGGFQGLPTDRHTLNNLMAFHPGLITQTNNNYQQHIGIRGRASSGFPQAALTSSNYQNLLTRQNSMNSTNSPIQHGPSSSNQAPSSITPGHSRNFQGVLPNGLLSLQQNQLSQPLQGGQALQQQMIQQYLQDMRRNNNSLQNQGHGISGSGPSYRSSPANSAAGNGPCVGQSQQSSRSNSFKVASPEGESRAPICETGLNQKASDLPQSRYFSDEMVSDIGGEFMDNGFFDDFDDNMNFSWKE